MATAVVQLELKDRPADIRVPGAHQRALILLLWNRRPVGQIVLPVRDQRIDRETLEQALTASADWNFWVAWLHDSLGWDEAEPAGRRPRTTIAVCTRNRPHDLARCLAAIADLPPLGQEVIVIDNNSDDARTADVVASFPGFRYAKQIEGGLNAARNRALREAGGEVVAFTDDDAVVDRGWLNAIARNFDDPLVMCATGLTMPLELDTDAQELFERHSPFGRGFRRRVFDSSEMNPMVVGPVGAGANAAFRRTVIDLVGEFDEALDAGTPTRSGGDHEMFSRILGSGFRIVYDPAAFNWHRHRRSADELWQTLQGYGTGVYAMWTRALLVNHEISVFKQAIGWIRHGQLPALVRAVARHHNRVPLRFVLAELRGCLAGPGAYLASRRALENRRRAPGIGTRGAAISNHAEGESRIALGRDGRRNLLNPDS